MSKRHDPGAKLYAEVQARQRNTTWPDTMVNSKNVDELVFKGSPKATKVQRVGIVIFGCAYISVGVAIMMMIVSEGHMKLIGLLALLAFAVGVRITWNAFRTAKAAPKNRHPHRIPSGVD